MTPIPPRAAELRLLPACIPHIILWLGIGIGIRRSRDHCLYVPIDEQKVSHIRVMGRYRAVWTVRIIGGRECSIWNLAGSIR